MDHQEIDVPSFFLCPISLQTMRDPVTVSTGITYDRESIEKWVFSNNNDTCPVTKQPLNVTNDNFLTPNHTLRRLIQSWCTINAPYGVERFPTPKPPVSKCQILKLVQDASASNSPQRLIRSIEKLKSIANESSANKRCLETTSQAIEFLARVIIQDNNNGTQALSILALLQITDERVLKTILAEKDGAIFESLIKIMQKSNYDSRAYAMGFMKVLVQAAEPTQVVALRVDHFIEVVQLLKDEVSPKATKNGLKFLALACPWGRNRVRAVEAGAVHVLVDLMLESKEKRTMEMAFAVLDQLCGCAEGRAELLSHGAGLAVVSKKILRVSHFASEKGVRILYSIARFSGSSSVVQQMLELGVVVKLCLVLQVDCDVKTKEKARDILKLHGKAWKNSPCAPNHILGSLPC
ncbi:E3 ubiquitin-protein ligase PUB23 [Silene latifolia]|uniref:E3 ubiquitin-protein ligase PUB23 n=1 Tax=Silene latifolia TaxID=37657 RepID=UPI003D787DF8